MGYVGRKGPKKDPTMMGSTMKNMSFKCTAPTVIVTFTKFLISNQLLE